jgi:hypothetical protein
MRAHPWNCLKKRATLAVDAGNVPLFGWANAFQLPGDLIRAFKFEDPTIPWVLEGQSILSNTDSINILYIQRKDDPSLWDSLFFEAVVQRMGADLCIPIRGDENAYKVNWAAYQDKLKEARHVNAQESTGQESLGGSSWIDARLGGTTPWLSDW